jgi:hypothetical protein
MNIRTLQEPTPEGRLAAVVRDEMMRHLDAKPPRLPDYADFREALTRSRQVQIEILHGQLQEARRKPRNDARVRELMGEIACLLI